MSIILVFQTVQHLLMSLFILALFLSLFWYVLELYNVLGQPEYTKKAISKILKTIAFIILLFVINFALDYLASFLQDSFFTSKIIY